MAERKNKRFGSSFDSFLEEEGILVEVKTKAAKKVFAWALQNEIDKGVSKSELAKRLCTSRGQLYRILDPENRSINLETMERIADMLQKRLVVTLEDKTCESIQTLEKQQTTHLPIPSDGTQVVHIVSTYTMLSPLVSAQQGVQAESSTGLSRFCLSPLPV